ncbi:MAG: hypothetical protein Q4C73_03185 [Eubacteriales bacterium]|nr:hypothetical protein [Eubacteriales bacterium]
MQNELLHAVTRQLDKLFEGAYTIYTENVEQGIETPCFFVGFLKTTDIPMLGSRRQRTWDMQVQFIPEEKGDNTHLLNEVCETLLEGLEWVRLEDDRLVRGIERSGTITDDALTVLVSFSRFLIRPADPVIPMGELKVEGAVK